MPRNSSIIYVRNLAFFLFFSFLCQFFQTECCEPVPKGHWVIAEAPGMRSFHLGIPDVSCCYAFSWMPFFVPLWSPLCARNHLLTTFKISRKDVLSQTKF